MPGLESFCVCTAIGLGSIFLLQLSWFLAFLYLDEMRVESGRDGLIPCVVHQNKLEDRSLEESFVIESYTRLLSTGVFKAVTIVATLVLFSFGVWGWTSIRQEFQPNKLMPSDSYLREWIRVYNAEYPDNGWDAEIFSGHLSHQDLSNIDRLVNDLESLAEEKMYLRGNTMIQKSIIQSTAINHEACLPSK